MTPPVDLSDVKAQTFQDDNSAGIGSRAFFAPEEYFDVIQHPKNAKEATAIGEIIEITADHTFLAGKGFHELYIEPEDAECNDEIVGGTGAPSFKTTFTGHTAGTEVEKLANVRMLKNARGILLVEDPDVEGRYIQVGNKVRPAKIMGKRVQGNVESGKRGIDWTAIGYSSGPIIYTGNVQPYPTV